MAFDFPVVDTHHHLWDLSANYYPWLKDRIGPRIFGDDYASIRVDYKVEDFLHDHGHVPVRASVHLQAEHDPGDPVRETAWLQKTADAPGSRGFPQAIVAFAALQQPDLQEVLEKHLQHRNVRGVRQTLHHHPELLTDIRWRQGLSRLTGLGLSFDLQFFPSDLQPTLEVVDANSDLQFILCHSGIPKDASREGRAQWRKSIAELARRPNVAAKHSGWAQWDRQWTTDSIRPLVLELIEAFGSDRCMFGTNYPVDRLGGSYTRIWDAYDSITERFTHDERRALFGVNATRFYRIEL
jgi:predicted TIM-barrel fold metal-dependent hydrolase